MSDSRIWFRNLLDKTIYRDGNHTSSRLRYRSQAIVSTATGDTFEVTWTTWVTSPALGVDGIGACSGVQSGSCRLSSFRGASWEFGRRHCSSDSSFSSTQDRHSRGQTGNDKVV